MADTVDCALHGEHALTLACIHLDDLSADTFVDLGDAALPVATCAACAESVDHDWTALDDALLEPMCQACFHYREGLLDQSADALNDGHLKKMAQDEMRARAKKLSRRLQDRWLPRWRFENANTLLLIDGADQPAWILDVAHLGVYYEEHERFEWAFVSPRMPRHVQAQAEVLRGLGDRLDVEVLSQPTWENTTLATAWIAASIAGVLVGAQGLRRLEMSKGVHFFLAVVDFYRPDGWIEHPDFEDWDWDDDEAQQPPQPTLADIEQAMREWDTALHQQKADRT